MLEMFLWRRGGCRQDSVGQRIKHVWQASLVVCYHRYLKRSQMIRCKERSPAPSRLSSTTALPIRVLRSACDPQDPISPRTRSLFVFVWISARTRGGHEGVSPYAGSQSIAVISSLLWTASSQPVSRGAASFRMRHAPPHEPEERETCSRHVLVCRWHANSPNENNNEISRHQVCSVSGVTSQTYRLVLHLTTHLS